MPRSPISRYDWLDRYLLRYGPATILGAVIIAYFYSKRRDFGVTFSLPFGKYETASVFLVLGFLYAYLASAPMLVFHFSRALFMGRKPNWMRRVVNWGTVPLVLAIMCWLVSQGVDPGLAIMGSVAAALWIIVSFDMFAAYFARDRIYRFYRKISARRAAGEEEFVESYRTLREHGNAFFILFWEIVLALPAVVALKLKVIDNADGAFFAVVVLCLYWVMPATFAWSIATRLEIDFAEDA